MAIPFIRTFEPRYGEIVTVTPMIRRVVANNPGPFTFMGTGVYIVGAGTDAAVIDPGPDMPEHVEALKRALEGRRLTHILVTHTHSDHSPAAKPLKEWSGAKTYAYGPHGSGRDDGPKMEAGGDMDFVPDVAVRDSDIVAGAGFTFECVHTPGHTSNHMCFALKEERALFTGDHIMGWSTTVVTPPDGDMAAYIASVEKLQRRDDATLYPTHGAPVTDAKPFLAAYREHRLDRERQVLAAIAAGRDTIPTMVARMYADVDKRLHPAASRSVLAHLIKLEREGRVTEEGGQYRLS
jgi:glyoxylase-like metal-dependent hydrolase (beta-lactamase superfamily II)